MKLHLRFALATDWRVANVPITCEHHLEKGAYGNLFTRGGNLYTRLNQVYAALNPSDNKRYGCKGASKNTGMLGIKGIGVAAEIRRFMILT